MVFEIRFSSHYDIIIGGTSSQQDRKTGKVLFVVVEAATSGAKTSSRIPQGFILCSILLMSYMHLLNYIFTQMSCKCFVQIKPGVTYMT